MRLHPEKGSAGVITASAGNHGQGVAYAAGVFKIPATVYVPETANQLKVEAIKRLGATVVPAGRNYNDAYLEAMRHQEQGGATFVHAFNDPDVIAGQGSIAVELLDDLEHFDTVLVPIGGGGLIGGISMYLKEKRPGVRVIGVEPAGADGMRRSLEAGRVVTLDRVNTIADGLAASAPGQLTLELAQRYVDDIVLVQDDEMVRAIRLLFEWEHLLAEPAGAAALAALLYHYSPAPNERVVVVLSGANVTDEVMIRALKSR
jgi:threonine dehydratase